MSCEHVIGELVRVSCEHVIGPVSCEHVIGRVPCEHVIGELGLCRVTLGRAETIEISLVEALEKDRRRKEGDRRTC